MKAIKPTHFDEFVRPVIPLVDLRAQYRTIESEITAAIREVLSRCNFVLGSHLEEFEQAFARFVGTEYAIGVGSGFDAVHFALMALDLGPADEVIVPANTYIATAFAVSGVGGRPVLVDCDPYTYNIAVERIEEAITSRTRVIIPVHLTGQSADMDPILEIASRHGLKVVEDAAQAHGALYKDRACGSMGIMGCFSFYPGKNLGAFGDGGIVVTNERRLAERVRRIRNYGQQSKNIHVEIGRNARLDTLQAAILNIKLRYLPDWNRSRESHAHKYIELLEGVGDLVFQQRVSYSTHVNHLFVVETSQRDALRQHLIEHGIECGIHYPIPISLQKAYKHLNYKEGDFPCAERFANFSLSLPMYPELTHSQIGHVAKRVSEFYKHHNGGETR